MNILVVSRDDAFRRSLQTLPPSFVQTLTLTTPGPALFEEVSKNCWHIVIVGPGQPGEDELEVASSLRSLDRKVPLILITRTSCEQKAVEALRIGANDYFGHSFRGEDLVASAKRLAGFENPALIPAKQSQSPQLMVGSSTSFREIQSYIKRVAVTNSTVLITGETGTGKELVAELVHRSSPRQYKPFVCINCAALPDSLLETELFGYEKGTFTGADAAYTGKVKSAAGGSVFLDEIGDLSNLAQTKILRFIESKEIQGLGRKSSVPVDVRIIAATNRDLETMVDGGSFRKDLYFRLNVARIELPALRDRHGDIPLLLSHYLHTYNEQWGAAIEGFTDEAIKYLLQYDWPGNVRELRNTLEAAFIRCSSRRIGLYDLPEQFRVRALRSNKGSPERENLLSALFETNWNKTRAAAKLQWSRMTLYRKMAKYKIPSSSGRLVDHGEQEQSREV